jgi:hypothetical protein
LMWHGSSKGKPPGSRGETGLDILVSCFGDEIHALSIAIA